MSHHKPSVYINQKRLRLIRGEKTPHIRETFQICFEKESFPNKLLTSSPTDNSLINVLGDISVHDQCKGPESALV